MRVCRARHTRTVPSSPFAQDPDAHRPAARARSTQSSTNTWRVLSWQSACKTVVQKHLACEKMSRCTLRANMTIYLKQSNGCRAWRAE
eukprot:1344418-Pleurochrysis_carterae.AAC.1